MQTVTEKEPIYLTPEEAAQYMRRSKGTIYNWVCQGRLKCYRAGNRLLFVRADLDRFVRGSGR